MKYLPIALLMIIISPLSTYALITSEAIEKISRVYHQSVRSETGLSHLTNQEIEEALRVILARQTRQTSQVASENRQIMQCQPRPHIIGESEIKTLLAKESQRLTRAKGAFTTSARVPGQQGPDSSCVLLHRCHENGGCCRGTHHQCAVLSTAQVTVDVTVKLRNTSFVDKLTFTNHTRCSCQVSTVTECICPQPFKYVTSTESPNKPCACQCMPGRENQCQQITIGSTSVDWNSSSLSNLFDGRDLYEMCYNDSLSGTWHDPTNAHSTVSNYCPMINCANGLVFDVRSLKCKVDPSSGSSSRTTQTNPATEYRTKRGVTDSSVLSPPRSGQTTPTYATTIPTSVNLPTPVSPTIRNNSLAYQYKRRSKLKRRIQRKLHRIQTKGLESKKSRSRGIGRKIFKEFNKLYGSGSRRVAASNPGDIVISVRNEAARVTCKPIPKDDYYLLSIKSHVLFCSVALP